MNAQRAVTVANDETMSAMIRQAERRIILMAPAVTQAVAEALVYKWQSLPVDAVTAILDVSADVLRLGYGDLAAMQLLERTAASLGATIDKQSGIRIGLLIVDDETLVYSPTPRLIEAGPKREETPNAIRLGLPPADVERDLGAGPEGVKERVLGLDKAGRSDIQRVEKDLKVCPPQAFDVARQVMVFNAYFEFAELTLSGIYIQRKTVQIPTDLLLALDEATQKKIHTTYKLIENDEELSSKGLTEDRNRLVKKHLRHIPGHGAVIQRTAKEVFLADFKKLKEAVTTFREQVKQVLDAKLKQRREALQVQLLPVVTKGPPRRWQRSAFFDAKNPASIRGMLQDDLEKAFGTAEQLVGEMDATVVFKAVTYESLRDQKFMELARAAFPALQRLYDEETAVKGHGVPPAPVKGTA